jgi:hypothetical protein
MQNRLTKAAAAGLFMLSCASAASASLTYDILAGSQLFAPNFENVTSVLFSSNLYWASIDNINVSEVPLPAGLAMLLSGLAAFGLIGRRQYGSDKSA